MSAISTRSTMDNAALEVYRAMAPALGINPESQYLTRHVGEFFSRDDKFISRPEQERMNPFMRDVASQVRAEHDGRCPSEVVYREAMRRMRLAVRAVAGKKGTRDGALLAREEVSRIQNPLLRAMVERAAGMTEPKRTSSYAASSSYDDGGASDAPVSCGPYYYDDVLIHSVGSSDSGWGPDGPSRRHSPSRLGPDGPSRSVGSGGLDDYGSGGTSYIGAMPIF